MRAGKLNMSSAKSTMPVSIDAPPVSTTPEVKTSSGKPERRNSFNTNSKISSTRGPITLAKVRREI